MLDEVLEMLLGVIEARRLVLFTGAGLSMPQPSGLPPSWKLAREAARRHEANTGVALPEPLRDDIEAQARYHDAKNQLESYFLPKLIDWKGFAGEPNAGHFAVADLLLSHAAAFSVTTNVDVLIERAAERLGDPAVAVAIDGTEAAFPQTHPPFLKIHGCFRRNRAETLWCREQIGREPWATRVQHSAQWLAGNLFQKDVVFVGYWTDWTYLNDVLARVLNDPVPRSVTLVDPSTPEALSQKAEGLWKWAHRDGIAFRHLPISGSEFLEKLRLRYSQVQVRRVVAVGASVFVGETGREAPVFPPADAVDPDDLYDLRRDLAGVPRTAAVGQHVPGPTDELLGKVIYDLVDAGAVLDGSLLSIDGKRVRVIQGAGRMLYTVRDAFDGDLAAVTPPDLTVCVGAADDGGAAAHVLRPERRPSVVRGNVGGAWCTHIDYRDALGAA
jgi:hypothetical protein